MKIETNDRKEKVDHVLATTSQSVDWYHDGEERTVKIGDITVTIRFVGRKGRRGRIEITAPAGAAFRSQDH